MTSRGKTGYVNPGSFCHDGDEGETCSGTRMSCKSIDGERSRWRKALGAVSQSRIRKRTPRTAPQKAADKLRPSELQALRVAGGWPQTGPLPRQKRQYRKLADAGFLNDQGGLTADGLAALRRRDAINDTHPDPAAARRADQAKADADFEAATAEDRSAKAGTDWSRYGDCGTCQAHAGQPCRDLANLGSLNATAHDGRPVDAGPGTTVVGDPQMPVSKQLLDMRKKIESGPGHGVTTDQARILLDRMTLAHLRIVAEEIGWPAPHLRTKPELREHIVRNSVGARLDSYAINPCWDKPTADAPAEDRSGQADVDWSRYDTCPTCFARAGRPCADLRPGKLGSFNATPHDGRPMSAVPADDEAKIAAARARQFAIDKAQQAAATAAEVDGDRFDADPTTNPVPDPAAWAAAERAGAERVGAAGDVEPFDPARHDVLGERPAPGSPVTILRPGAVWTGDGPTTLSKPLAVAGDVDRSAQAGTDWSQYSTCPACTATTGQPCRDLGRPGSLNATPHPGRPTVDGVPHYAEPTVDPEAAYTKAVTKGVPTLTDDELNAARQWPDASRHMRDALHGQMERRTNAAWQEKRDADLDAARRFRTSGSDADLEAARSAASPDPRNPVRAELDRQTYLRGLNNDDLTREAAEPMSDFDREQYGAELDRRGIPHDRSADAGTDWSQYDACPACTAGIGEACHDLARPGSRNAAPHPGRGKLASRWTDWAAGDAPSATEPEKPLEDRIRDAYDSLATRPGGPVPLADLRDRLGDVDREDLDRALLDMDDHRDIQLEPDPDRVALTPRDKEGAIPLVGQPQHLLRFRDRSDDVPAEPEGGDPEQRPVPATGDLARVRAAYGRLAGGPGDWVGLGDLRAAVPDMSDDAFADAVRQSIHQPDTQVEEQTNQKTLTAAERAAAVTIGGRTQHLFAINPEWAATRPSQPRERSQPLPLVDRSREAGTDWRRFDACHRCSAGPAGPCYDLSGTVAIGSYNAHPHDGRPTVSSAYQAAREALQEPPAPRPELEPDSEPLPTVADARQAIADAAEMNPSARRALFRSLAQGNEAAGNEEVARLYNDAFRDAEREADRDLAEDFTRRVGGASVSDEDADRRVLDALTAQQGSEWSPISAVRSASGLDRPTFDQAVTRLSRDRKLRAEPEPIGHRITDEDRNTAVMMGGEPRHRITSGDGSTQEPTTPPAVAKQLLDMREKIPTGPDHGVTREKAAEMLNGLTAAQLKDVADRIGYPAGHLRAKDALVSHIVQQSVGHRLTSYAINPRWKTGPEDLGGLT